MLSLKPSTKKRAELLPRLERPFLGLMENDFGPLFERFFGKWPVMEVPEWPVRYPPTINEKEKEVIVRVELPGFALEEVKVEMKGDLLSVEAEHKEAEVKDAEKKCEGPCAHVKREIELPVGVDVNKAEALYRNGVLEVRLPKTKEVLGRRIEVKT